MFVFFSILIIVVCVLLVLIVLVQNSKGGGLAAGFASSNQFMGVRKTADFLEKATWTLGATLLVLSLLTTITGTKGEQKPKSVIDEQINNISTGSGNTLNFPTEAPAEKPAAKPAEKPAEPNK